MLSIIVPAYNQHELTGDCLRAIQANTVDYEVIIVDNGSDKPIQAEGVPGHIIRNESNLGFPVAVNQGIKAASGDIIILLNNDVIVTKDWATRLVKALNDYSIVSPMTNYCAGLQRTQIGVYEDEDELNKQTAQWAVDRAGETESVNWIIGFCMAFKKSLYDELGPFDESLWPCSGEEIDFCLRARKAGHRVGIVRDVYVHHFGSQTFQTIDVNYQEICTRNDMHLQEKWGPSFGKQTLPVDPDQGIRLNMGSGPFPLEGFTNIDQFEHVNPDICCDVLNAPFEPGTVDEIYAGHILEHFIFDEGQKALRYWFSLLKSGGKIAVSVPDYDFLVKEYAADPTPEKLIVFNDLYIYSGVQPSPHQYAYSAALLEICMKNAGFVNIERMPVNHPYFPSPVPWQCGFMGVKP